MLLLLCLIGTFLVPVSLPASTPDWTAREGEVIVNGSDSGETLADEPGEVSLRWYDPDSEDASYASPATAADTVVDHRSGVLLDPERTTLPVTPGDTVDLGVRLANTGNGPDTYGLSGSFVGSSVDWDTTVYRDTDEDSSGSGEPVASTVTDLPGAGTASSDTGLVLRFDVPDTATGGDTFVFRARSNRTSDPEPGADSVTVPLVLGGAADVSLTDLEVLTSDSAVVADGSGTFGIRATWRNDGTADSTVTVDPSGLTFRNFRGESLDGFDYSLTTTATPLVPAGDTVATRWSVQRPDPEDESLLGLSKLRYGARGETVGLNVARPIRDDETNEAGNLVDNLTVRTNPYELELGEANSSPVFDGSVFTSSDRAIVLLQQGDSTYLGTPVVNPERSYGNGPEFRSAVRSANEELENREAEALEERLYSLSLWKNRVGGTYVGDSGVLRERATVSLPDPTADTVTPRVAKLLPEKGRWHIVDQDPALEDGRIRFRIKADPSEPGAGFSVFRLLSGGGVEETGRASETMVYPNPFVPFDGRDETGEYGRGPDQGLYFAAGEDVGFPAGTHLAIYTVTGDRVFEKTTTQGGIIRWNPRTRSGDPVASGVYVYRITTPDGSEKVGKFSIVR